MGSGVIRRLVVCYICGREFGRAGIVQHEPQCLVKFSKQQLELPKKDRKKAPQRPAGWDAICESEDSVPADAHLLEAYNECAQEALQANKSECEHCFRTFSPPDRLQIHLRSCGPDSHFAREAHRRGFTAATHSEQHPKTEPVPKAQPAPKLDIAALPKLTVAAKPAAVPAKVQSSSNFCGACGVRHADSTKFCVSCGVLRIAI